MDASDVCGVWVMKGDWRKVLSSEANSKDWVSASVRRWVGSQVVVGSVGRGMSWMGWGLREFLDGDWILCSAVCMMLLIKWVSGLLGEGDGK
ncbi:hypothetical protein BDW42DRAFT_158254 [Aspergillus taichungensis]|uniref:Transmembrane protein n=1 Tax=Aspergillus taichungensis TaxID=482145 RepID=A0A2J5I9C9_9EURO|nr:hypothetical protein BDW42DRAFT_158254 [Aspergillus taichungensis]